MVTHRKFHYVIMLIMLLFIGSLAQTSAGNVVQQTDPTAQQQTIEAMVAQMFAATQTAQAAQPTIDPAVATAAFNATLQAQFAQALTATANAAQSSPTPVPSIIVVNSSGDDPRGCPRTCTFRSAVASAQPGDIITFDPALSEPIRLSQSINFDKTLTIAAEADHRIIFSGESAQATLILIASNVTVQMANLSFLDAEAADQYGSNPRYAIANQGTLKLSNVNFERAALNNTSTLEIEGGVFTGNRTLSMLTTTGTATVRGSVFANAGIAASDSYSSYPTGCAINNTGTAWLEDVIIQNNICAKAQMFMIQNQGQMEITGSTIRNNTAIGAISTVKMLTVENSTLAENGDFGIGGNGYGDVEISNTLLTGHKEIAVASAQGKWVIINSTIANNPGMGIQGGGSVLLSNSTVSANHGGAAVMQYLQGDGLRLSSSIVAGNTRNGGNDVDQIVISLGNNLIGDPGTTTGWFSSDLLNIDPLLAPLADNGGTTQTMALYEGSPAIGAGYCLGDGDLAAVTTDQRGVTRKDPCDIGAYETELGSVLIAPTPTPTFTPSATLIPESTPTITSNAESITGQWEGNVDHPGFGSYSTVIELLNCSVGKRCGTVEYPEYSCGGNLILLAITSNTLQLREQLTYGTCNSDTIITFELEQDGRWYVTFVDNGVQVASAYLQASQLSEGIFQIQTPIPVDTGTITGRWSGEVSGQYGSFSPVLVLTSCSLNQICGTVEYSSLACGGEITLVDVNDHSVYLYQDITYGNCLDDYIRLEQVSDDRWQAVYFLNEQEISRGILTANDVVGFDDIESTLIPPDNELRQWAARATASSQYGSDSWSASQATGAPDSQGCGDQRTAWASANGSSQETLTLYFDQPVYPTEIHIHQNLSPGAITRVSLIPADSGAPIPIPNSTNPDTTCPQIFTLRLEGQMTIVNGVMIEVDQSITGYWNEIDAVELVGKASK